MKKIKPIAALAIRGVMQARDHCDIDEEEAEDKIIDIVEMMINDQSFSVECNDKQVEPLEPIYTTIEEKERAKREEE